MTDDEKKDIEVCEGKLQELDAAVTRTHESVKEGLTRIFGESTGRSLAESARNLFDRVSQLYDMDAAGLDAGELAMIIDFKDSEDPDALVPIVADEIKKYKSEYKLETLTVEDMLDENIGAVQQACMYDPDADPEDPETPICIYDIVMHGARKRLQDMPKKKEIVSVGAGRLKNVFYPLDPYNGDVWGLEGIKEKAERKVYVGKKYRKKIYVPYWIDFQELQKDCPQLNDLTQLDKRIMIVSDGLYRAGSQYISYAQVHDYIGYKGNAKDIVKEAEEFTNTYKKLNSTVHIDNSEEVKAYKDSYPRIKGWGSFLPTKGAESEDVILKINGRETHGFVKVLDTSFVVDLAIERGQFSEVPIDVFQTPFHKDDYGMKFEDYFLTWILHVLNNPARWGTPRKMSVIYECFGATGKDSASRSLRYRLRKRIAALLDYYRSVNLKGKYGRLEGYEMEGDNGNLTLKVAKETRRIKKK